MTCDSELNNQGMGRKQSSNYMGHSMLKHLNMVRPDTATLKDSLVVK